MKFVLLYQKGTTSGVTAKNGDGTGNGAVTCSTSTLAGPGTSCCATDLCNGAKMNGMSMVMAITVAMMALFRAM